MFIKLFLIYRKNIRQPNEIKDIFKLFMSKICKIMEHTNLFLFEDKVALDATYPDGKVTTIPGVAYSRASESENYSVLFNNKITNYILTLQLQDKSGVTVGASFTAQTPNVLDGETIKYKVVAPEVKDYKPKRKEEKINVSGDMTHTIIYLGLVSYTVTVHHTFSGTPIEGVADTQVVTEGVWDESPVKVTIEPVNIAGYKAEPVTIIVSGSCEYNLEYEKMPYEAIDLGLLSGTKWASKNVGAESPEGYGNYYAWGEIEPNKASAYTLENYKFYDSATSSVTKYNTNNKMTLDLEDDVANIVMGGEWHMPTSAQCAELLDNTTSSWTTDYNGTGVVGLILASKNNENSIFFPAAGMVFYNGSVGQGVGFYTWCSSLVSEDTTRAWIAGGSVDYGDLDQTYRFLGLPVRGVIGELNDYNPGGGGEAV